RRRGRLRLLSVRADPARHCSALRWLTGLEPQEFAERCWGRVPRLATAAERGESPSVGVHSSPEPEGVRSDELFSLAAAEELIARRGLRTPFLRMVRDGADIPTARFTSGGGVGATINDQVDDAKVRDLFAEGATAVLQGLHRTWAPLNDFTRRLAHEVGHPVQANAYVTPSANQGFAAHYDVHDVFVLQVHGEKEWRVHAPVLEHPLRDQPWNGRAAEVRAAAEQDPLLAVTLAPGDCLYLPRGFVHSARALGGTTAHLTLGVHTWTRQHLAQAFTQELLARVAEDPWVRASLALGVTVGDAAAMAPDVGRLRDALADALKQIPDDDIVASMAALAGGSMRPGPVPVFTDRRGDEQ
ncbi:MAG: cupin domain-containing protein, partial [Propionibacteriaceae bacterium]|nr:cupin domain-containing protein [Propionibacteriaceae bacterium]